MIPIASYYTGYTDHMWRFYIKTMDGNIADCTDADRANWCACHNVYHRIRPEWQNVVRLCYQKRSPGSETLEEYCRAVSMPLATAWKIVRSVQTMAAEERGLIAPRYRGAPYRLRETDDKT